MHDMQAYIRDHKLFYERQNKKCLWALQLVKKCTSDAAEGDLDIDEETQSRLQRALSDTHSNLTTQYEAFRRTSERQLEGDILGLSLLPSFEQWLDDFDHEGHSQWDFNDDEQVKSSHKVDKSRKKRLDSESSSGPIEDPKSMTENAQKSKTDVQRETEPPKVKKKRGPYKKKTPEEKKAIKMAGAKIEQLLLDITESNSNNSQGRDDKNGSVSESSPEKSMNKETRKPKNNSSKAVKVPVSLPVASDSDEFMDCPSPFETRFSPSPSKPSRPSNVASLATDSIKSSNTNSALAKKNNSSDGRREKPFVVSEKSLFGDDSSDAGSDTESAAANKSDSFTKDDRTCSQPPESREAISNYKKVEGEEKKLNSKPVTTKDGSIGRSIHGVAKVSRVFNREVVSGCAKRGVKQQPVHDEPIKLGATKKPAALSYNVKEIGNLMRETMKEKQKVITGGNKTSNRIPVVAPPTAAEDIPIVCKRRMPTVFAPVKSKAVPNSNTSDLSHKILSMEEKSLTKYKSQNKDPSVFSSSDSSDSDDASHSPVRRSPTKTPVEISQKLPEPSLNEKGPPKATAKASCINSKGPQLLESSKNNVSPTASTSEKSSELNKGIILEDSNETPVTNTLLDSGQTRDSERSTEASIAASRQTNTPEERRSPQKALESTESPSCARNSSKKRLSTSEQETSTNAEKSTEDILENVLMPEKSFERENNAAEISTTSEKEHADDQRAILSDDLAMSSDSEDDEDCLDTITDSLSLIHKTVRVEDVNLSDASPERPARPSSLPLCNESPTREPLPSSPSQRRAEADVRLDFPSNGDLSSKTSTPIKESICTTDPQDISDVVKSLSLDDSLAVETQNEMVENDVPPTQASISQSNNKGNERISSIFDDEDSCLTPTPSEPLVPKLPETQEANKGQKIPTAFAGLNLSLTDDDMNDSDDEDSGNKASSDLSDLPDSATEQNSTCEKSKSSGKENVSHELPCETTSTERKVLGDTVSNVNNNNESFTSAANSPISKACSNSEAPLTENECRENSSLLVTAGTRNFSEEGTSSVASPVLEAPNNVAAHEKSVSCVNNNESKFSSTVPSDVASSAHLESNFEQSVENVVNDTESHDVTKKATLSNGCAGDKTIEKCGPTELHTPAALDSPAPSKTVKDEGNTRSPINVRKPRMRSRSSSSSSRRCSSSVESKAEFGSPHSYGLRKRVSSHDSGSESTPYKAASSKRSRKHSGKKMDSRCQDNSFSINSPPENTPDLAPCTESISSEPCPKGPTTRQNSARKSAEQNIRSVFDALKSPNLSSEIHNFDLPPDIETPSTSSSAFNEEQNQLSQSPALKEASQTTVRSLFSPDASECTSAPSKNEVNDRLRFLPPVIVQTRRSARQRRSTFSSAVARSVIQQDVPLENKILDSDSHEKKSNFDQNRISDLVDSEANLLKDTRSSQAQYRNDTDSASTPRQHQKTVPNTDLDTPDHSELTSCGKKSEVLSLESKEATSPVHSDESDTVLQICIENVLESTPPQNASPIKSEVMAANVQKTSRDQVKNSQRVQVKCAENEKEYAVNKHSNRVNSIYSSKTSIPAKPLSEVDPTSRITRRRKAMVFKSTKRHIVGTPPRCDLKLNTKPSLTPLKEVLPGNEDFTVPKDESGKRKLEFNSNQTVLSVKKLGNADSLAVVHGVKLPSDVSLHDSGESRIQNKAFDERESEVNSTKTDEENNPSLKIKANDVTASSIQSAPTESTSCKRKRDKQLDSTRSLSTNVLIPKEVDSASSSYDVSLKIDSSIHSIKKVDDSESEGEMCIHIDAMDSEEVPVSAAPASPDCDPSNSQSLVLRGATNRDLELFGKDDLSSSDDNEEDARQSSSLQRKRKRLASENEARLEPSVDNSKSKCKNTKVSEPQNKKHKPSLTKAVLSVPSETKTKVLNSTPRQILSKNGSFSISQLQELERRKLTSSKSEQSLTPMSNIKCPPIRRNKPNENTSSNRPSSNKLNDATKMDTSETTDSLLLKSRQESCLERKKSMAKEKKPLAKRTARLSKSAAAAAVAAARRTMTGQRTMASHVKRSIPSPDDSSSDELNIKRTPGKSSMLIESDSEPEESFDAELPSKAQKTCKERVATNRLDLNSVVQNLTQKSNLVKKSSILLERKSTVKAKLFSTKLSSPVSSLDTPSVNYTVKENDEREGKCIQKLKSLSEPTSTSYRPSESYSNKSTSTPYSSSAAMLDLKDEKRDSDNDSALQIAADDTISSLRFNEKEETRSMKVSTVNAQAEWDSTAKFANLNSIQMPTEAKKPLQFSGTSSVLTNASSVHSISNADSKLISESFTSSDNRGKNDEVISKPVFFYGKDLLMSPHSDDDEQTDESDCSEDLPSSTQELCENPTSTDSSEHCSVMRLPPVPAHLVSSFEQAQLKYCDILRELENVRLGSAEWKACVITIVQDFRKILQKGSSVPIIIYLQPLARAFIESILCVDPTKNHTNFRILCPELYMLFMLAKVIESNLNLTPAHSLEDLITCMCENLIQSSGFTGSSEKNSITLNSGAIASLCSWHTASCCVARKEDRKPQWRRSRAFIVSLLCHYPGLAHSALLSSLFLGRLVLLRLVKYRSTTCLERVIRWLVHHGAWVGRSSVRTLLIDNMNARYMCEKMPAEPMVLVQSIFETLLDKVDKATKARLDTPQNLKITIVGLMVLSCWKGKTWLLNELLPYIVRLLTCKRHVSPSHLRQCIISITCALLPRVGVQTAEIVELLRKTKEEGGAALFAAAKYKDQKLKPDPTVLSKMLGALAEALEKLLSDESS